MQTIRLTSGHVSIIREAVEIFGAEVTISDESIHGATVAFDHGAALAYAIGNLAELYTDQFEFDSSDHDARIRRNICRNILKKLAAKGFEDSGK